MARPPHFRISPFRGFPIVISGLSLLLSGPAAAHVSEQALVLLLPTDHYIFGGCLSVLASILLISLAPDSFAKRLFTPFRLPFTKLPDGLKTVTSILSFLVLVVVIWLGLDGPRDPLINILPLAFWTGFWVIFVTVVGLAGNFWVYVNPWTGPYRLIFGASPPPPWLILPDALGAWPAVISFFVYSVFFIVDPAPDDPDRLGVIVASYWLYSFAGMALFGKQVWMARCEAFSVLFALLGRVSFFGDWSRPAIGLPGWALTAATPVAFSHGVFALMVLGVGSFDGLKETFWWLGTIGVNPLEFPGRTAVMGSSTAGMMVSIALIMSIFSAVIWMGAAIVSARDPRAGRIRFSQMFRAFAPAVLPIALGYHTSHFLVTFLVNGQYLLAGLGDPLATGANFLGLGDTRITTGFLKTISSVQVIWLTQAGMVVAGHVLSVLVSHRIALTVMGNRRQAVLCQIPLACFMVLYTLFGLWLLAAPRGM